MWSLHNCATLSSMNKKKLEGMGIDPAIIEVMADSTNSFSLTQLFALQEALSSVRLDHDGDGQTFSF